MIIMAQTPRMTKTSTSFDMDMEFSTGPTELTTKVSGTSIRLRAKEHFGMLKVMFTGESSKMTWPMDMESTLILMEVSTRESSRTTCRKATERKSGSMEPNTWAPTKME